jgi:hypothetical protein
MHSKHKLCRTLTRLVAEEEKDNTMASMEFTGIKKTICAP